MRIAFIGQKGIPAAFGGVERHVEEVAVRMADTGHEVFAYVRNNYTDPNLKEYKKVKLIHLPSLPTKHLDAISHTFLTSIHALFKPYDVIHYQAIGPTSLCWLIKIFKPKTALVATFHCQDYFHQKWGWLARFYLKMGEVVTCRVPSKTIVVSQKLAKYVRKKYGVQTVVINNGAQVNFRKESENLERWKLEPRKYLLFVGRLIKHKGVHYLIEAFNQLEQAGQIPADLKLAIVGEGFHTDDYVNYLKKKAEQNSKIVFTGNQSGEALEELFSHAYLFVQPSEYEGLSIALLEAMGYGLPVIFSDIAENQEAAGETGIGFKNKDVEDLKKNITLLLENPQEAETIGQKARERIEKNFNWDVITEQILNVYREILKSQV